ncbi:MAG: hypothetical protein BWY92_00453 [Firmicutes bacterium ADurb.BinA052]|jgi:hypothetical protein|nr:MAG: hypothetical protein BWY92_00453 [Firmicutes bacterium ADurb.BinA052]
MITLAYYLFCGYIVILLVRNFLRCRNLYDEILYAFAIMPFVLRVIRLK